jgi:Protein of unknown function (DUF559)
MEVGLMEDICSRAEDLIQDEFNELSDQVSKLRNFLHLCESPAEQILVVALHHYFTDAIINSHFQRMQATMDKDRDCAGIFTAIFELQKPIKAFGSNYRADLFAYVTRIWIGEKSPGWGELIIEVDGHDFHERTKQQASKDKQPDRHMILQGFKVMRFTGSEVYNDPIRCAEEICFQLEHEAGQVFCSYRDTGRLEELIIGSKKMAGGI